MTENSIYAAFRARFARSYELYERALHVLPGGAINDVRQVEPFPPYFARGEGCRKWDVEGNEYIDYVLGHGALMLGHSNEPILRALNEQGARGFHLGGNTPQEVAWAEWVCKLVPSAELTRFVNSGSEATDLAIRLARGFTGRKKVVRVGGSYHGWNDHGVGGSLPDFESRNGVLAEVQEQVVVSSLEDLPRLFGTQGAEIAALLVLPADDPTTLQLYRRLATESGAVLIFDEVFTGFRVAPGGVQAKHGVLPDLTTLGKIVSGGLPAGAVAGRRDIMALLEVRDPSWMKTRKVLALGTFSGNPLCAAVGVAMLEQLEDGEATRRADSATTYFTARLREVVQRASANVNVWSSTSSFFSLSSPVNNRAFHCALTLNGVSLWASGLGTTCAVHTERDLESSIEGVGWAIEMMKSAGFA